MVARIGRARDIVSSGDSARRKLNRSGSWRNQRMQRRRHTGVPGLIRRTSTGRVVGDRVRQDLRHRGTVGIVTRDAQVGVGIVHT